ncbi:MAG: nucleotide exchange factor GrpE [Bacillota bacterium]
MIEENNRQKEKGDFEHRQEKPDREKGNRQDFASASGHLSGRGKEPAVEMEKLRRDLENEKNRHLRTKADFENYRKRMIRDTEAKAVQARKDILLDLLNFVDYFEQARKQIKDPAAAGGIEIMARQFNELLHRHGVRRIECLGEPYNPEAQEGIGYVETDQCADGCVAEEVSSGYRLGDILLRPARVMVARNPSEAEKKEEK